MTFDEVYQANRTIVQNHARRLVGPDRADDLAQEVWIRAALHFDQFKGSAKPSTWLYRIAFNTAVTLSRRKRVRTEPETEGFEIPDGARDPEEQAIRADQRRCLAREVARLRPSWREAVHGFLVYGFTAAPAQLRICEGTFKSRLHRARKELERRMAQ